MPFPPFLAGPPTLDDAGLLIEAFGESAAAQAFARSERSRRLGNHIRFCHWRETARLIAVLTAEKVAGTIH